MLGGGSTIVNRAGYHDHRAMVRGPIGVLVVDDHEAFRSAVSTMLAIEGHLVVTAEADSAAGALLAFDRLCSAGTPPALLVVDVHLGTDDGMDLAATLVSAPTRPVVVTCSTAPLAELPPLPADPDVTFIAKQDLDAAGLWAWYRARRS